jgi:hypothetical protein
VYRRGFPGVFEKKSPGDSVVFQKTGGVFALFWLFSRSRCTVAGISKGEVYSRVKPEPRASFPRSDGGSVVSRMSEHESPECWADMAIGIDDKLTDRNAGITCEAGNLEVRVPNEVGEQGEFVWKSTPLRFATGRWSKRRPGPRDQPMARAIFSKPSCMRDRGQAKLNRNHWGQPK